MWSSKCTIADTAAASPQIIISTSLNNRNRERTGLFSPIRFSGYFCTSNDCLMNFEFTEEQLMIRQAARDFARTECLPGDRTR
jgi:hypothetical protein